MNIEIKSTEFYAGLETVQKNEKKLPFKCRKDVTERFEHTPKHTHWVHNRVFFEILTCKLTRNCLCFWKIFLTNILKNIIRQLFAREFHQVFRNRGTVYNMYSCTVQATKFDTSKH